MDDYTIQSNLLTGIPLLNFMENSNAAMGIKCNMSRFVYIKQSFKDFHNVSNNFDYEGRFDEEFPCPCSELAAEYKAHDRKAETIKSRAEIISTSYYTRNSVLEPWYCIKFPIYGDDGNASGTIFFARKFTFISIFDFFKSLKPSVITFNPPVDLFTERELEIIFFAIQKIPAKAIAPMLCISHRTVENRLLKIYEKAGTNLIKGLIEYCHNVGLNNYGPKQLLREGVNFCW